ncbi:MAG: serine/threonine-protein kinase [Mariprofundaceae bacterium]
MNNRAFWKSDWFFGGLLVALFCFAHINTFSPLKSIEWLNYDMTVSNHLSSTNDNIVIIDIDDASIERIGRWPWPRSTIAEAINILNAADSKIIGLDVLFSEKQKLSKNIQLSLQVAQLLRQQGQIKEAKRIEFESLSMNEDLLLITAIKNAGNVHMPFSFDLEVKNNTPSQAKPAFMQRMQLSDSTTPKLQPVQALKLHYPFDDLAAAAAGLGFQDVLIDSDGNLRSSPLIVQYQASLLPSMPLAIAAQYLHLNIKDIRMNSTSNFELGGLDISVDQQARIYPAFHENTYKHYSFHDVISKRVAASNFKNKIVLIGVNAASLSETYDTPVSPSMSSAQFSAHVLQSILDEDYYTQPYWAQTIQWIIIFIIAIYLLFITPLLSRNSGIICTLLLSACCIAATTLPLITSSLWLQTSSPIALLLLGHILLASKRYFDSKDSREQNAANAAETNKMLGLSFQSQGMLDMAFDKFRKCPVNNDILQCIYNLALDFERKRQFNKATSVYEYILENNRTYKDTAARVERIKTAGGSMIFGGSTSGGNMSSLLVTGGAKPTLGRYEVIRELGKGAMGTVYLGRDPKINREVAIKTMALAQEFEADEMDEVKERFFREAETAGRLNHPNIVTIFDAGEEHDLAYIAMEFLNGTDLTPYTKKGKLFPHAASLKICGKVAEALNYAQSQHVVHRDIKPANIMLLKNKTIKVTDFGIARITASSKTKTGVVLGTPSYMSPEQLSGKHVDGRSDLFSLGVMMYEMLSGTRPFRGDSMATLMFQIANEPHPDIREHCSQLSERTAKLIDHMLCKDPEARISNGGDVIKEIIKCLAENNTKRGQS